MLLRKARRAPGRGEPLQPRRNSANDPIDADREYGSASATISWDLGGAQVKAVTGYQRLADYELRDDDSINVSAFPSFRYLRSRTFTQELNLSGSATKTLLMGKSADGRWRILQEQVSN